MKKIYYVSVIFIVILLVALLLIRHKNPQIDITSLSNFVQNNITQTESIPHPLEISFMRKQSYPGSDLVIEKNLSSGKGFTRYVASYRSDGLTIKGLLAIPTVKKPEGDFPAIIFNHGYIEPEEYKRDSKYLAYIAGFANNGYVVFMPDYRGHQDSQGDPTGGYFSPGYTIDSLNALSSLKKFAPVNPDKIGVWGHSMGGHVSLRSMVINSDIKAGVIWAGVTASYEDMSKNWRRSITWRPSPRESMSHRPSRQEFIDKFGEPEDDTEFWKSISPFFFTSELSSPIQLHHGVTDNSVPWEFSKKLYDKLISEGEIVEYYQYPNGDHNLSGSSFPLAMKRSNEFFDKYLK